MLRLIRDGRARTHAELVELTGLSRSTVAQRVDSLLTQQLVVPAEPGASRGGRPPRTFAFNRDAGVVLAADLGATHSRVAVTDLAGDVLAETREDIPIAEGRRSCWPGSRMRSTACSSSRPRARRRPRRGRRRPGAGRVRHRHAGGAADHARLGRLRRLRASARALRRAGAGRQRRQHHGPRRVLGALARHRAPVVREGRHRDRVRRDHRRAHPPRRAGRGRRHRPHPRPRPRRRDLPLRQPRLPGGDRRRRRDGRAA